MASYSVKPHVVVFSYPAQGHINPLMEFAKRLALQNLLVTFVITEANKERMLRAQRSAQASSQLDIQFETISDGLPSDFDRSLNIEIVVDALSKAGKESFEHLIKRLNAQSQSVSCIVYDSFLQWVSQSANKFNIPSAFFWTQSCAVYSIYYHYERKLMKADEDTEAIEIPGLPQLYTGDLPSFLQPSDRDRFMLRVVHDMFNTISEATWILGNSFDHLEAPAIKSMDSHIPIRTVGPLLPCAFLDGNNPQDTDVGAHLWKAANCMEWLNTKEDSTVVYVSFGSVAILSKEQIHEIAIGLKASGHSFLWVIRPGHNEGENKTVEKLPEGFLEEIGEKGLVVSWCPQMQVLTHPSVGVFMTHCGWNSTLESLSSGIAVLAVPQWSDQTTNSKYVEEVWKSGIRVKKRAEGVVGREELEKYIRVAMESERGVEMRKNALRWKTAARDAMVKGGSSDKNIADFVEDVIARAGNICHSSYVDGEVDATF